MTVWGELQRRLLGEPRTMRVIDRLAEESDGALGPLFEEAAAGALLLDREGRVRRANAALRRMAGTAELSAGTPAEPVFAAELREAAWDEIGPVLAGRQAGSRSFVSRLEAGETEGATVSVSVSAVRERDGGVSGALLWIVDISVQKQLEAQLAQSQKLQAVGQLAGGIAHDFNNLLTAVIGAADSIESRDGMDAEVLEDAAQIRSSAERGAALVRQLLAFGRQQTLQPKAVLVNEVIADLSGLLRRLLGGKVRLQMELETPGRMVRVDPTQLDQVLVNLAVNARDAMMDGGTLTLRSGHMTVYRPTTRGAETIPPGRYVKIEVQDTGMGIPPEVLPRIFDPFFTTKRDRGGSGLGLSTVHGIVRQSDGFLVLDSEVGTGTTVQIFLPRWDGPEAVTIPHAPRVPVGVTAAAAPAEISSPSAAMAPTARLVLLVEDEEPVRQLAERTLARRGWTVMAAESGEAALALLEGEVRALAASGLAAIVTDVVMPGMDGVTLVRTVRERLALPDLPAILVSGYAEEALRRDVGTTATAFLPKPYSLKGLAAKLDEVTQAGAEEASAEG